MFLGQLNETQKQAFLGLARQVITADKELRALEVDLLKRMQSEMDLDRAALVQTPTMEDLPSIFHDNRSRGIVLLELMRVAWTDSEFNWRENKLITEVASQLEVNNDRLMAMQQWALRFKEILDEALDLWAE